MRYIARRHTNAHRSYASVHFISHPLFCFRVGGIVPVQITAQRNFQFSPRIAWLVAGRLMPSSAEGNHRSCICFFFFSSPPPSTPAFLAAISFSVAYPSLSSTTPLAPENECLGGDVWP